MGTKLQDFLRFMNGEAPESELTRRIESAVRRARSQQDWRKEYMLLYELKDEAREEGLAEGRAQGLEEGRAQDLEEGRAEGRAESMAEMICAMHEEKLPLEQIARISHLTEAEVREIVLREGYGNRK